MALRREIWILLAQRDGKGRVWLAIDFAPQQRTQWKLGSLGYGPRR